MTKRIVREFDPILNSTQVVYRELDDGGLAEKLHDIMNRNILNWASIAIVIACLVVMVTKLRASVRFRSSAGAIHSAETHTGNRDVDLNNAQTISSEQDPGKQTLESISSRQMRWTKIFKGKSLPSSEKEKQQMLSRKEGRTLRYSGGCCVCHLSDSSYGVYSGEKVWIPIWRQWWCGWKVHYVAQVFISLRLVHKYSLFLYLNQRISKHNNSL